ncbi:hypothetical protein N9L02_01265 [Gammaproteobacteria bacterium]|nr:hypothetical protein [Gammaproteobacteria bacterium]
MKNIILGITGSVAAIKSLELSKKLLNFGNVKIILTKNAEYFVKNYFKDFKNLEIEIYGDQDEWPQIKNKYDIECSILHIAMRRWADVLIVAPLGANTMAKIVNGYCDNLLTSTIRAWEWPKPIFLSPAMNTLMWNNCPTQDHIQILKDRGFLIIDPISKNLACKDIGMGAMAEIESIIKIIDIYFSTSSAGAKKSFILQKSGKL